MRVIGLVVALGLAFVPLEAEAQQAMRVLGRSDWIRVYR